MVTRKPVGPRISTSNIPKPSGAPSTGAAPLPYPTTPVLESAKSTASSNSVYSADLAKSPAFELIDVNEARQQQTGRARSDSDGASSHGTWNSDDTMEDEHDDGEVVEVPKPLNVRASQVDGNGQEGENNAGLPASLRIGAAGGQQPQGHKHTKSSESQKYEEEAQSNPWAEQKEMQAPPANERRDSNNPYLRQNGFATGESSQSAWQDSKPPPVPAAAPPPPPSAPPPLPPSTADGWAPVELPTIKSPQGTIAPSEWMSEMSLDEHRPASWETAEVLSVPQRGQSPFPHPNGKQSEQRPVSTWWQDPPQQYQESRPHSKASYPAPPYPTTQQHNESVFAPPPGPPQTEPTSLVDHQDPPPKPPRQAPAPISTSHPPGVASSRSVPETPGTQLKRQKNEHYQIKHINWLDSSDSHTKPSLRQTPILTQNANGPCPLLALVNALVLTTPHTMDTALLETLRTREQVSLGLLLDAVFDELMSGRRGDSAQELPDVSDLYSFLLALHTGMNVNPRFVTPTTTPRGSLDGHPATLGSVHPIHRAQRKASAFEETKEMRLYSTFNIPLIHGWTPPADTPAYEAFMRNAQTFEDAQNIQFAESELEDKLRSAGGLPPQEQQMLQDIQIIKAFLDSWPTQLTDFGLQTIAQSMGAGSFAILFRNDHFSTIYKEPTHGALMTLVTDAGYSTHDEIVWESLVDVTGAASEMFSGDFRTVSHNQDVSRLNQGNSGGGEEGWQTVQNSNSRNRYRNGSGSGVGRVASGVSAEGIPPPLPGPRPQQKLTPETAAAPQNGGLSDSEAQRKASEQEDHDLALALQLQEEEEAQQRESEQRRRREQELSEQFLSNESEGPRPAIPPRRTGGRTAGAGPTTAAAAAAGSGAPAARPPVNRPTDRANDAEAPPSYEQAASDRPYRPAGSTAAGNMQQGNPLGAYDALRRQQSAYAETTAAQGRPGSPTAHQGPAAPAYSSPPQNRRRNTAGARRSSQMGIPGGQSMPGAYVNQATNANGMRVNAAPGIKEADDRCVVM